MPTLPCAIAYATCGSIFDAPRLRADLKTIEDKLADPAVWGKPAESQVLMRDRKRLEEQLAFDTALERRISDIDAYFDLAREGEAVEPELEREIKTLGAYAEQLETKTMLGSETDPLNAIVTVHPGAGGTPRPSRSRSSRWASR